MSDLILYSIVIPTYNRIDLLTLTLQQIELIRQSDKDVSIEVIVSDDSKDSLTQEMILAEFPNVIYTRGPQRGPAANRNHGVSKARGEWIVFTDDDCLPDIAWLNAFRKHNTSDLVLEGKTIADRAQNRLDEESPINEHGGCLWSCNFAIRKDLFHKLEGFDETYPYAAMEDMDFREKVIRSGGTIKFLEEAIVVHPWRIGLNDIQARMKSRKKFLRKYPDIAKKTRTLLFIMRRSKNVSLEIFRNLKNTKGKGLGTRLLYELQLTMNLIWDRVSSRDV